MPRRRQLGPLTKAAALVRAARNRRRRARRALRRVNAPQPQALAMRQGKFSGHGAYSLSDIASAAGNVVKKVAAPFLDSTPSQGKVNSFARSLGNDIGSMTGIPGAGAALGNAASWFSRLIGFGDYATVRNRARGMSKNTLMGIHGEDSGFITNSAASFSDGKGANIRIRHREYIMDVSSTTGFSNVPFLINAGNPQLFPWLSQLAALYEHYKLHGMVMQYVPLSGTAQASTLGVGSITMATDYDSYDVSFPNKRVMEQQEYSLSATPFQTFCHPIECAYSRNQFNEFTVASGVTTTSGLAGLGDYQKFGPGIFQMATQGQPASGTTIGELWVAYDIEFLHPTGDTANGSTIFTQHVQATIANGGSGAISTNFFTTSTGAISNQSATLAAPYFKPVNEGTNTYQLQPTSSFLVPGNYCCMYTATTGNGTLFSWTGSGALIGIGGNATVIPRLSNGTTWNVNNGAGYATGSTYASGQPFSNAGMMSVKFASMNDVTGFFSFANIAYDAATPLTVDIWIFGLGSTATSNPIQAIEPSYEDRLLQIERRLAREERRLWCANAKGNKDEALGIITAAGPTSKLFRQPGIDDVQTALVEEYLSVSERDVDEEDEEALARLQKRFVHAVRPKQAATPSSSSSSSSSSK